MLSDNNVQSKIRSLIDDMDPEDVAEMQRTTHVMGILIGIKNCNTLNHDVLVEQIFNDKLKMIPKEIISDVVSTVLPELLEDGAILTPKGKLTKASLIKALDYEYMMEHS